jgi:hypothetical protein
MVIGEFYVNGVNRTSPRAAIDFEPNNTSPDKIKNISIGQLVAKDIGAGVLFSGVSEIENITINSVILKNVTNTSGITVSRAKNISIGMADIEMANADFYGFRAVDYENVYVGCLRIEQAASVTTGAQGGVIIDPIPVGAAYANDNLRIDYLYLNGAGGNGFRQRALAGNASLGYAQLVDVAQNAAGAVGFFLESTCVIDYAVATDGSGDYALRLGSNTNRILSGELADGSVAAIGLFGNRADFGSTKVNGQPYQNNFYSGTGTPEGVVTANVGALFFRSNGGAGTTLYVKESGTSNTGWVGK